MSRLEPTTILMISKPIVPPWNDSSKNLVKDIVSSGRHFRYRVLTPADRPLTAPNVISETIYSSAGKHTPALQQNLRVFGRLLRQRGERITHFFFAPNRRAARAIRAALGLRRRMTVQTVCSVPKDFRDWQRLLFADRVVVVSRATRDRFVDAGVPEDRLEVIPPGIRIPEQPTPAQKVDLKRQFGFDPDRPLVLYPGDYQFSRAADTFARAIASGQLGNTTCVFACRVKQQASLVEEQRIRQLLREAGASNVHFYRHVDNFLQLLAASDVCLLPAESTFAKMDLPLVLIEALALGVPIVVADLPSLRELLIDDVGLAVQAGQPQAVTAAIHTLVGEPQQQILRVSRCRKVALEHFSIDQVAARYEQLYQRMLN